ncbi:MAG: hypothetical protein JNM56_40550 [Planctomycetia bacterium]|nr:hypothetical protein [Planctomycetia bacterium]
MPHITLTEEQASVIAQSGAAVEIRDPNGNWLGRIDPQEAALVAEVLRRRGEPRKCIPAAKVEEHLRALSAEWERTGGFDRQHMLAFLENLRTQEES